MQEHVHHRQRPGAAVGFLAVEGVVACPRSLGAIADFISALDQQRAGAAGGVVDALSGLGVEQLGQQAGDFGRGVEFACLFACPGGELADQVFVGVADHVHAVDPAGAHVQLGTGEILQ